MYIRQTCLFSFEEIMNFQQETKLELILAQINISPLVAALSKQSHLGGPKGYRVAPMIYALIAKQIQKKWGKKGVEALKKAADKGRVGATG